MADNNFRLVGAGKTFLSPTDFIIQVDTSAGAVTLVLPKISTILDSYTTIFQYMGIRIVDISDNASVNNITIEGFETNVVNGSSLLVLNTNGAGGIFTLIGNNQWSFQLNSTSGGGSNPVDILYADLYNLIINSQLVAGQKYRLTDYKSVNFLNGWEIANNNPASTDPNFNPREIYTGDNEVLILEAISNYELNPICVSEVYSSDIIEFQAYTNKIGVEIGGIFNGQTLPDSSIVSGFDLQWDSTLNKAYFDMPTNYPALFGHYFYLSFDILGDNFEGMSEPLTPVISKCNYDYNNHNLILSVSSDGTKVYVLNLTQADVLNYDADTLYVETIYAIGDAYGCITRRNVTSKNVNVPFDCRARTYRRFEVDMTSLNANLGMYYWGQGDNWYAQGTTGNYKDFLSIDINSTQVVNVYWDGIGGLDMYQYAGYCDNNVFVYGIQESTLSSYTYNNTFLNTFYGNKMRDNCYYNSVVYINQCEIGDGFGYNLIGNSFYNNKIGNQFVNNNILSDFRTNIISNNFYQNIIANGFRYNICQDSFYVNQIGDDCRNNYFNFDNFNTNILGINFNFNIINWQVNNIDFTSAFYVKGYFNCTISQGSNAVTYISSFDGTTQQNITPINS